MFSTVLEPNGNSFRFIGAECSNRQRAVNLNFVSRGQVLCI